MTALHTLSTPVIYDEIYRETPGPPGPYPEDVTVRMTKHLRALLGNGTEPQEIFENLGIQLSNFPGGNVLRIADAEGLLGSMERMIIPYAEELLLSYTKRTHGLNLKPFWNSLPARDQLIMALLLAKDPITAEHCFDTLVIAFSIIHAVEVQFGLLPPEEKIFLFLAAIRHDTGKLAVPDLVLGNPFKRDQLPRIYLGNLLDPKRTRDLNFPIELLGDERRTFEGILKARNGKHPEPEELDKAQRLVRILIERRCDFRELIPIRFLFSVARDVVDMQFPPYTPPLTEKIPNFQEPPLTEADMEKLNTQRPNLGRLELILDLAGMDGWKMSFKDAIEMHESAGARILTEGKDDTDASIRSRMLGPVLPLVIGHHNYDSTKKTEGYTKIMLLKAEMKTYSFLIEVLKLIDIICALAQHRPYKPGKPAGLVMKIVREEALKLGVRQKLIDLVTPIITQGNAPVGQVLNQIRENVREQFGPLTLPGTIVEEAVA